MKPASLNALFLSLIVFTLPARGFTSQTQTRPNAGKGTSGEASQSKPPAVSIASTTEDSCGCESPTPDVLAIVNGVKLTMKDIDTPETKLSEQTAKLESQVITARQQQLDLQVNAKLFDAEAKKRGIITAKLLEQEVAAKVVEPTEAEAQAFYDQNKTQIAAEFKDVKGEVIDHLRDQRQQEQSRVFAERLRAASGMKPLVNEVVPPSTPAERARVLASVHGQQITSGDIEENLRPLIFKVREAVHKSRMGALDARINLMLLEDEVRRRQVSSEALLQTEVVAKTAQVTEANAQDFYNANKNQIKGDFAQVRAQLIQYLQQREQEKAAAAFVAQLRKGATIQIFLKAPEAPVYNITVDDQPVKGNENASVTVVEFTDFQCPACAQTHPVLDRIANEYGDRIKLVVRDYPLKQHANAFKAAEAAEAAREQGKYWEYATILFSNQSALETSKLKEYATRLGLDRVRFDAALDSGKFTDKVQRDLADGNRFGASGTPTIYVNGREVTNKSYEALKAAIEAAIIAGAKR